MQQHELPGGNCHNPAEGAKGAAKKALTPMGAHGAPGCCHPEDQDDGQENHCQFGQGKRHGGGKGPERRGPEGKNVPDIGLLDPFRCSRQQLAQQKRKRQQNQPEHARMAGPVAAMPRLVQSCARLRGL